MKSYQKKISKVKESIEVINSEAILEKASEGLLNLSIELGEVLFNPHPPNKKDVIISSELSSAIFFKSFFIKIPLHLIFI